MKMTMKSLSDFVVVVVVVVIVVVEFCCVNRCR
jgi:hypothetical protein